MAQNVHITHNSSTEATARTDMDNLQSAIITDADNAWSWMVGSKHYYAAAQKYYSLTSSSFVYLDADFNTVTVREDGVGNGLLVSEYVSHFGDTDTRIRLEDDKMTIDAGGVSMLTLTEDGTQDMVEINKGLADVDFIVHSQTATSFMVEGSTGDAIVGQNIVVGTGKYIGMASDKGRIVVTDDTTDSFVFSDCHVGIQTTDPINSDVALQVYGKVLVNGNITSDPGATTTNATAALYVANESDAACIAMSQSYATYEFLRLSGSTNGVNNCLVSAAEDGNGAVVGPHATATTSGWTYQGMFKIYLIDSTAEGMTEGYYYVPLYTKDPAE